MQIQKADLLLGIAWNQLPLNGAGLASQVEFLSLSWTSPYRKLTCTNVLHIIHEVLWVGQHSWEWLDMTRHAHEYIFVLIPDHHKLQRVMTPKNSTNLDLLGRHLRRRNSRWTPRQNCPILLMPWSLSCWNREWKKTSRIRWLDMTRHGLVIHTCILHKHIQIATIRPLHTSLPPRDVAPSYLYPTTSSS